MKRNTKSRRPLSYSILNVAGKVLIGSCLIKKFLDVDLLLKKACEKSDLNDFGPDSFREGLGLLVESLNREAKLNPIGQYSLYLILLNSLIVRLKTQDWLKSNPEVVTDRVESPFIILGMPRTGTTLLSFLLEMDPENRSLLMWESEDPAPPPQIGGEEDLLRIRAYSDKVKMFKKNIPGFEAIHPIGATLPTECIMLLGHEFKNVFFTLFANIPTYREWFMGADALSAYKYHKLILQILQSSTPAQSWSLKSPAHLFNLQTLLDVYPDAKLIFTHRDPRKVISSFCSLTAVTRRGFSDEVDPIGIGSEALNTISEGVKRAMDFEKKGADNRFFHLEFAKFMSNPIDAVKELYRRFGKEVRPLHEKRMRAWIKFYPRNKYGSHSYSLSDYGLTTEKVEEAFGEYRAQYNIPFSNNYEH